MTVERLLLSHFVFLISGMLPALAQEQLPAISIPSQGIKLKVVVDNKSGQPVTNLGQQDFTVVDNKTPRAITSFKVKSSADEPVRVILVIDAVNTPFETIGWTRTNVEKFLRENGGKLDHPTTIAVLTDKGMQINEGFSTDGNALSDTLEHYPIGLREITRASEGGDNERMQICIKAFQELVTFAATVPGRKIGIWISPGWPLLSGSQIQLDSKQKQQIFDQVVFLSTRMRQIDLSIYDVNPFGMAESVAQSNYFETFLKGITKPEEGQLADLGIQVLSIQSGGLALESSSDIEGSIKKCLTDAQSWYEITFDPPPADKPNEYHHIEIRVDQRGLTPRARDGYYANPQMPLLR
jgi:VWFA-related protein